jgi:hypothetical protein
MNLVRAEAAQGYTSYGAICYIIGVIQSSTSIVITAVSYGSPSYNDPANVSGATELLKRARPNADRLSKRRSVAHRQLESAIQLSSKSHGL